MADSKKPFVITDRRKFTKEGEPREVSDTSMPERLESRVPLPSEEQQPASSAPQIAEPDLTSEDAYPAPTEEQLTQARLAYRQTADRLDTAIRAANPGADHPPAMSFEQLVQSIYMTSIVQLGGATPEGRQPQVDILGARQSIDMLDVIAEKTEGKLSIAEQRLLDSALFELRMAFLEITQVLARSAQTKSSQPGSLR